MELELLTKEELEEKIKIAKGFELADLLREKIRRLGYRVIDTPNGSKTIKI